MAIYLLACIVFVLATAFAKINIDKDIISHPDKSQWE